MHHTEVYRVIAARGMTHSPYPSWGGHLSDLPYISAGSRKQDEAGSTGNGSRKSQKEERSAEKDGDLLLAGSSAGSAKSRHGGSVYDLLVAEIKV